MKKEKTGGYDRHGQRQKIAPFPHVTRMLAGAVLPLVLTMTLGFMAFAGPAPTGPGAKELTGMERYDEETLARLQDNRLEYQEIRDRIHEYNPTFTKIWGDYMDGRADYAYLVTELESQYRVVKDTADGYISMSKLPGMSAMASVGRSLDKSYRNLVQNMRDTVNQWETNTQAQRQFQQVEKQLTAAASGVMIGYDTIRQNRATLETLVQLYEQQIAMSKRMAALGMATDTQLLQAESSLAGARASLASLGTQQENTRRALCMLLGYDPDSYPEICPVPPLDRSRLDGMNLEQDTIRAIGNNYTLISQRTSQKGGTPDQIAARSRMIEEGDQKVTIEMQRLYQDVQDKRAACEAAQTGFEAAELSRGASERQYKLGLLSEVQYVGTQISYYQKLAEKQSAELSLLQAMENYDWGVNGFAAVSD